MSRDLRKREEKKKGCERIIRAADSSREPAPRALDNGKQTQYHHPFHQQFFLRNYNQKHMLFSKLNIFIWMGQRNLKSQLLFVDSGLRWRSIEMTAALHQISPTTGRHKGLASFGVK